MDNKCPKCGEKLSVFYMKQTCPRCGANLLYYGIEERLAADAKKAQNEVESFWRIVRKIDFLHLIEKYYKKRGEPFPWENGEEADENENAQKSSEEKTEVKE